MLTFVACYTRGYNFNLYYLLLLWSIMLTFIARYSTVEYNLPQLSVITVEYNARFYCKLLLWIIQYIAILPIVNVEYGLYSLLLINVQYHIYCMLSL